MSSIGAIGGSGNWSAMQGMQGMRRPPDGGQKMAAELFSQIDSSGQGYIDKSTLKAALEQSSSLSDSSSSGSVDELFSALDGNSDGKITKDEFTSSFQSLAQQLESQLMSGNSMQAGNMPPPPHPHLPQNGAGFTKDELTSQLDAIGSSDSTRSSLISSVIENFDQADSDGDGKVSFKEAMAFDQSNSGDSTTSSTSGSSSSSGLASEDVNAKLMRQLMQLMQAYNLNDQSSEGSNISLVA